MAKPAKRRPRGGRRGKADLPARLKALEARAEDDMEAVEGEVAGLLEAHPDCVEGHLLLAQIRGRRNDYPAMVAPLTAALALEPKLAKAHSMLGRVHVLAGDLEQALDAYGQAVACGGDHVDRTHLSHCLLRLGRTEEAIAELRRALRAVPDKSPDHMFVRFWLMRALRQSGGLAAADAEARRMLAYVAKWPLRGSSTLYVHCNQMDFHRWDEIRDKELMHRAIVGYRAAAGDAAVPNCPATYVMPDDFDALAAAAAAAPAEPAEPAEPAIWIVKPTSLFGGQGMRLTESLDDIPRAPGYLVQRYVANPLLIDGKKSHIRLYLLIASVRPLRAYLWQGGVVRFAPAPFRRADGWLDDNAIHITNTALHRDHPDLVVVKDPKVDGQGNIWSLAAVFRRLAADGADTTSIWHRFCELAVKLVAVIKHSGLFEDQARQPNPYAFPLKVLGLDVLLDDALRPWLLETQRAPAPSGDAGVITRVNGRVFQAYARMSVFELLGGPDERTGLDPETVLADHDVRVFRETELEHESRDLFVRLIPPG